MVAGVRGRSVSLHASARPLDVPAGRGRDGEIAALQRARLLSAAVGLLAERGYGSFSAAALCARAGVSRRTFYEIFEDRDACLLAILQDTEELVAREIERFELEQADWRERVRLGLWVILCMAESNPVLAKVCLIESQKAGRLVQQRRERTARRLIAVVDEGRALSSPSATAGALTAEALVGAALSIIAARLADTARPEGDRGAVPSHDGANRQASSDLRGLLGELMSMIALPYLGATAARREMKRPLPRTSCREDQDAIIAFEGPDPLSHLRIRFTYRTARVLQAVAQLTEQGASASNRRVANHAGVSDPGQISKLLARLREHGLLENTATGNHMRGEANQWRLTPTGRRVVQSISPESARTGRRRAA